HTNSMDETLALPSEHAATLSLRTQQVLAYETGVTNSVDPLGGSYMVETMTRQMRADAAKIFAEIERRGGMIPALNDGYFRRSIAESAFAYQRDIDAKRKLIVGVNAFQESDGPPMDLLTVDPHIETEQVQALRALKARRNAGEATRCLDAIRLAAGSEKNVTPALLAAADARCTVGEIMAALADVFGRFGGQTLT
ncbi:MAG TPA: methylmalonyl-CoA mutase family protein, partial [Gemmataceae bacterium]|nr:methylmalonyl-CoA mutase family protein [Gemmataceae bacterium]